MEYIVNLEFTAVAVKQILVIVGFKSLKWMVLRFSIVDFQGGIESFFTDWHNSGNLEEDNALFKNYYNAFLYLEGLKKKQPSHLLNKYTFQRGGYPVLWPYKYVADREKIAVGGARVFVFAVHNTKQDADDTIQTFLQAQTRRYHVVNLEFAAKTVEKVLIVVGYQNSQWLCVTFLPEEFTGTAQLFFGRWGATLFDADNTNFCRYYKMFQYLEGLRSRKTMSGKTWFLDMLDNYDFRGHRVQWKYTYFNNIAKVDFSNARVFIFSCHTTAKEAGEVAEHFAAIQTRIQREDDDYFTSSTLASVRIDDNNFKIDVCKHIGNLAETTMLVMAFYYYKILTVAERQGVHLSNSRMFGPQFNHSKTDESFAIQSSAFYKDLDKFILEAPINGLSVTHLSFKEHATVLILDAGEKRLEFYDINGRHSIGLYDYFIKNRPRMLERYGHKILKIWSPTVTLSGDLGSCALWSSILAIFRMRTIAREHLPTKYTTILEISDVIRKELVQVCGFEQSGGIITKRKFDKLLFGCNVSERCIRDLRELVVAQELVDIPADFQLDDMIVIPKLPETPYVWYMNAFRPASETEDIILSDFSRAIHRKRKIDKQDLPLPFEIIYEGVSYWMNIGQLYRKHNNIVLYLDNHPSGWLLSGVAPANKPVKLTTVYAYGSAEYIQSYFFMSLFIENVRQRKIPTFPLVPRNPVLYTFLPKYQASTCSDSIRQALQTFHDMSTAKQHNEIIRPLNIKGIILDIGWMYNSNGNIVLYENNTGKYNHNEHNYSEIVLFGKAPATFPPNLKIVYVLKKGAGLFVVGES